MPSLNDAVLSHRSTLAYIYKEENFMDSIERLDRMDKHLKRNPNDYQTVIARMKLASDIYDHQMEIQTHKRLGRLAEIKRKLREEDEWRKTH